MNERVERVRLPQGLNECRLDKTRDKSKPPAAQYEEETCKKAGLTSSRGIMRAKSSISQRRSHTRSAADGTGTPRISSFLHVLQIE